MDSRSHLKNQVAHFEALTQSRQPDVRRFVNDFLQGGAIGIAALQQAKKGKSSGVARQPKRQTKASRRRSRSPTKKKTSAQPKRQTKVRRRSRSPPAQPKSGSGLKKKYKQIGIGIEALLNQEKTPGTSRKVASPRKAAVPKVSKTLSVIENRPCHRIFTPGNCAKAGDRCVSKNDVCYDKEFYKKEKGFVFDSSKAKEYEKKYKEDQIAFFDDGAEELDRINRDNIDECAQIFNKDDCKEPCVAYRDRCYTQEAYKDTGYTYDGEKAKEYQKEYDERRSRKIRIAKRNILTHKADYKKIEARFEEKREAMQKKYLEKLSKLYSSYREYGGREDL